MAGGNNEKYAKVGHMRVHGGVTWPTVNLCDPRRPHDRQMPDHTGRLADKNFLTRMLFKDSYWLISIVIVYSQVSAYAFCHVLIKKWLIDLHI